MLGSPGPEAPILTPTDRRALPPESRLESTALHLEASGAVRALIGFVERWSEVAEPTPRARLAQARALLDLKLMDRAWVRLKEVVDGEDAPVEALVLTARMFVERGWPTRAKEPLDRALALAPDDAEVQEVWEAAQQPPLRPDPTIREEDHPGDLAALLPVAEHYLAAGSFVKAQRILQHLEREHPGHPRVGDLLWALDGDFRLETPDLWELVERLGPDLAALADLPDEAEHTESAPDLALAQERPEPGGTRSFPHLFRGGPPAPTPADDEEEVTQTAAITDLQALAEGAPTTVSDADDTRILRVIHSDMPGLGAPEGPLHRDAEPVDSAFDLAAFRREMGMERLGGPEEEDEDLIVVTRREREPTDEITSGLPTIEPDPTTSDVGDFGATFRAVPTPARPEARPVTAEPPPPPAPQLSRASGSGTGPWWILVVAALLVMGFVLLIAALLVPLLAGSA